MEVFENCQNWKLKEEITNLVNKKMTRSTLPLEWKMSIVLSIFKKEDTKLPENRGRDYFTELYHQEEGGGGGGDE